MIGRLFPRKFFLGPMVVNGMRVPLDMTEKKGKESILKRYVYTTILHMVFDPYGKESKANVYGNDMFYTIVLHIVFDIYGKESKANVYGKDMFIQLFYTMYLNRKEKNAK